MRKEKQLLLDEIIDHLNKVPSFIFTSYQGINPNLAHDLRMSMIEAGGFFQVVKKRVFLKAVEKIALRMDSNSLQGHIGIVYAVRDVIETTKALYQFIKTHKGCIEVVGGICEGKAYSPQDFKEISTISNLDQLRAEFLSVLTAPTSELLGIIEALLRGVIVCIDQKSQKESC